MFLEILGFLLLVSFALGGTVTSGFMLLFGGEEFSPPKGRNCIPALLSLAITVLLWYAVYSTFPFTIGMK